jgi:ATP-binding cassette, subfamily C, bacterial LapB
MTPVEHERPDLRGAAEGWLKPMLRPLWPRIRELVVFSLSINLLALATPVFVLQVYDRVVFQSGLSTLKGLAVGMVVVIAFDYIMRQARARLMQRVALRIDVDLGRRLFDKLSNLPLRVLESRPGAYWQSLFRDAEQVRNVVGGPTAVLMVDLPFVILFIGLIYLIAQPIVWVLVVALIAFVVLALWSSWSIQSAAGSERRAGLGRDALLAEMIAGRTTSKALALGDTLRPKWEDAHAETISRSVRRGVSTDGFGNAGASFSLMTTVAMTAVGALAILDLEMTIGSLIAANMLSGRIIAPLNQLVGAWRSFGTFRAATQRLNEVFAIPEDRSVSEIELARPNGALTLEDLVFRFEEDGPAVIDNVKFTIKPGGMHGIVGHNGSGKTTLLKLMLGLYTPSSGRVLLDDADISQFSRRELANWIGYVPQDGFLFAGTVRDNIAMRLPESDDQAIIEAATQAGVHDAIVDFADGYATDIGEAGGRLSAGQRQRIAIARALLGEPPVLLLDEPSSNLDRDAEEALRDVLVGLARSRNVVVVTHSPMLLAACNNIIAMDRGRVAVAGPAGEILPKLFKPHPPRQPRQPDQPAPIGDIAALEARK